jgi:hypothetical protein
VVLTDRCHGLVMALLDAGIRMAKAERQQAG